MSVGIFFHADQYELAVEARECEHTERSGRGAVYVVVDLTVGADVAHVFLSPEQAGMVRDALNRLPSLNRRRSPRFETTEIKDAVGRTAVTTFDGERERVP